MCVCVCVLCKKQEIIKKNEEKKSRVEIGQKLN